MTSTQRVHGALSYSLRTDKVQLWVTQDGGQLAPVVFLHGARRVQPFSIAPWCEEAEARKLPVILRVLRGDFFCLPFGGNEKPFRGERHPLHGETANGRWNKVAQKSERGLRVLGLSLRTRIRKGRVDKEIVLDPSHHVVYQRHTIRGMKGPMCYGHHAMLQFPAREGCGLLSTSRFVVGRTAPRRFEDPPSGGYSLLSRDAEFGSLQRVPTTTWDNVDLSVYPARRGFEDLVQVVHDPTSEHAWFAVSFPRERHVWFSVKNPRVLSGTVLWFSNGGRHYPPWNGRHVGVLGVEDVTSFFHYGLAESAAPNPFSERGLRTSVNLDPDRPHVVPYAFACVSIPARFDRVAELHRSDDGKKAVLLSTSGKRVSVPFDWGFLEHDV